VVPARDHGGTEGRRSPTYVGPGGRESNHVAAISERAAIEAPSRPFRTDLIEKTAPTDRLAGAGSFLARASIAETQIRPALQVLEPEWVEGKRILVFDDVFTGGLTLREVAYKLRAAGAEEICGVVLARGSDAATSRTCIRPRACCRTRTRRRHRLARSSGWPTRRPAPPRSGARSAPGAPAPPARLSGWSGSRARRARSARRGRRPRRA
jgi:hypothetical protein